MNLDELKPQGLDEVVAYVDVGEKSIQINSGDDLIHPEFKPAYESLYKQLKQNLWADEKGEVKLPHEFKGYLALDEQSGHYYFILKVKLVNGSKYLH